MSKLRLIVTLLTLFSGSFASQSAMANLIRTFDSYHAFFVYGDGNGTNVFEGDATNMQNLFAANGWDTHLYGPREAPGNLGLRDALTTMRDVYAAPNELLFFYYSGHGNGYYPPAWGGGTPDGNGDENQQEDPLPPGVPNDVWDESLSGSLGFDSVLDDEFGLIFDEIQSKSAWVSGAIDACHANGMLDGSSDVSGFAGKESVWFTSVTEWQRAPICAPNSPLGTLATLMLNTFDPLAGLDQLGDLWDWYWDAASYGVNNGLLSANQTLGLKIYEEDGTSTKYYVPEPSSVLLILIGATGIWVTRKVRKGMNSPANA